MQLYNSPFCITAGYANYKVIKTTPTIAFNLFTAKDTNY